MIGSLKGRLLRKRPNGLIIEANGVGYEVNVSLNALSSLPEEGKNVFMYIYTHVKEDAIQLYGFLNEEERRVFITVLGVSGVGPRIALSILSGLPLDDFMRAIDSEDISRLTIIPGLGKKTAQRLILELRERLPKAVLPKDRLYDDAVSALINLGYRKSDALDALDKAYKKGHEDIETLLKVSLKYLTDNE